MFDRPVRTAPVAVLDLEMTGLSPKGDRVCEIAVVRSDGDDVVREYQTLLRPGVPMSDGALRCHGITDTMVLGSPVFTEVAGDVVTALQGAVVVAHNVDFDLGFLHRELDGAPVVMAPPVTLDTLLMARRLFAFRKNGLHDVCKELEIPLERRHRALSDARATFRLFRRMLEILDPDGEVTVRELSDLVGALAPNTPLRLKQQQVIRDAFREQRTIEIEYQSTSDPLGGRIVREVDLWFVRLPRFQGWCHLRGGERVFRLERVREVRLGSRVYEIPGDATCRV